MGESSNPSVVAFTAPGAKLTADPGGYGTLHAMPVIIKGGVPGTVECQRMLSPALSLALSFNEA